MAEKNKNNNSLVFADNGYLSYIDFSKLSFADKLKRRLNIAKAQFDNGSLAKAGYALVGGYDPENPRLSTGDVPNPGMRNPKLITQTIQKAKSIALRASKISDKIFDRQYLKAINSGNPKRILAVRGLHFKGKSGLNELVTLYHNTPNVFNLFKIQYPLEVFFHFDPNLLAIKGLNPKGNIKNTYLNIKNPLEITDPVFWNWTKIIESNPEIGAKLGLNKWNVERYYDDLTYKLGGSKEAANKYLMDKLGYDGFTYKNTIDFLRTGINSTSTAVPTSNLIKSSDAITYDNKGNIIPISQRDNFLINDIRYKQGGKMNILEFLKNGSGIHIKEKNKGKFTKSAKAAGLTVQEHARSVLNDPNATPLLKKRANFARNAAKWKHKEGGIIIAKKGIKAGLQAKQNLTKRKAPDWDNLDRGYRYLTQDMKLPHDLAIAIMGNVVEESQGDYKAVLKNGGGRGLIQWDGHLAPTGRYGLWGKIWASVAKPANVYDSKTDTMKNYWAPWGGLKGEQVRLKFINAPLKTKTKIYAESYLRPGKSRIKDRQLSAMLLDSIYNPRIKNIIINKEGGIIKASNGTKTNFGLKVSNALGKVGNFLNSDTGKLAINGITSIIGTATLNRAIDKQIEANNKMEKADIQKAKLDRYRKLLGLQDMTPEIDSSGNIINKSSIVALNNAYKQAMESTDTSEILDTYDRVNRLLGNEKYMNLKGMLGDMVDTLSNLLGGKKKDNNSSNNSYFGNYVNMLYKNLGTFNSDGSFNTSLGTYKWEDGKLKNISNTYGTFNADGSMNLGNGLGTFSIKDGYRPRKLY